MVPDIVDISSIEQLFIRDGVRPGAYRWSDGSIVRQLDSPTLLYTVEKK